MDWFINRESDQSNIDYIRAYGQFQLKEKEQIGIWTPSEMLITPFAKEHFNDRLKSHYFNNKFTIKISDAKYEDSGTYYVKVLMRSFKYSNSAVMVNIYGMLFSY